MAGTLQRRLWVLLGAAAAALLGWLGLPGTALDRAAFSGVVRGFANPPLFISGNGSQATPWKLRTFASRNQADKRQTPVIVSLGDDPAGFFQSSPPSPIDLAVMLSNFQRLGANQAASAVVLAWDSPDPIGLAALDKAIRGFDSLVMAAPLARGAVPEPMPAAFRQASVPLESARGDISALPMVNRIPLSGVILGGPNTAAGFQTLDSEPGSKLAPLLARWEDRVVFAFPLLCALQRLDLPLTGVDIRLGESIHLGPNGPIIPIDRFGRLAVPLQAVAPYAEIAAESLIDGAAGLIPPHAPQPVVLRDDRSAAEPATRAFSKKLPALIAALASDSGLVPARDYHRLLPDRELAALLLVALALTALCALPAVPRNLGFLTISGACLAGQCLAAGAAGLWLPGLPALAAIAAAWALSATIAGTPAAPRPPPAPVTEHPTRGKSKPTPQLAAHPAIEAAPEAAPEPAPEPPAPQKTPKPARKPARKTARKTAAKTARKATPKPEPQAAPEPAPPPPAKKSRPPAKKRPR